MFSKPLFKQSCKANAGTWTFVTAITCFMLAIIIFVLGNLNVNEIRASMTDMFVKDAIETTIEEQSMTYFNLADNSLDNYQTNFDQLKYLLTVQFDDASKTTIITAYNTAITEGATDEQARAAITAGKTEEQKTAINTLLNYYLVCGEDYSDEKISNYVLNGIADAIYNQLKDEKDEETADNAKTFITTAINNFIDSETTDTTEFAANYIPAVLTDVFYQQSFIYDNETFYISSYLTKQEINDNSNSAIASFRAQLNMKEQQIREENPSYSDEQVKTALQAYTATIIEDMTKTLVEQLPQKVTDALSEIGNMDVYGLVVGSIFFRIAGLLLPMIFVIMTANNLIAGQVDSGSMAYVLSTPTKRKTVAFTQIFYMFTALLLMFSLTTITSVVCLAIVNSREITINYSQLLLLNLGAFITMFAISGICFLASCIFNRSKMSMSVGGGLSMFFLVATILGLFGSNVIPSAIRIDAMKMFNYVSIITLFDAISILNGTLTYLWKFAILIIIGIVAYTIGVFKFDKKDLPL